MPSTSTVLPFTSPALTVQVLLKNPQILVRRLTDLTYKRFIADRIFFAGSPESVQGGAARFQRSESIFPDRPAEELAPRTQFPRASWTEDILTAAVREFGLEIPINDLAIRRNQIDLVNRGLVKLANAIVQRVDGIAMSLLLNDPDIQTLAGSGDWSTAATDIIKDVASAKKMIEDDPQEGYEADTLVVHPDQNLDLLVDKDLRDALPRERTDGSIQTGIVAPMLGLRQILKTPSMTAGTAVLMSAGLAGTIADEQPVGIEGWTTYNPGGGQVKPIYTKVYRDEVSKDWIIAGARWPAMWLAEPKAVVKITGI